MSIYSNPVAPSLMKYYLPKMASAKHQEPRLNKLYMPAHIQFCPKILYAFLCSYCVAWFSMYTHTHIRAQMQVRICFLFFLTSSSLYFCITLIGTIPNKVFHFCQYAGFFYFLLFSLLDFITWNQKARVAGGVRQNANARQYLHFCNLVHTSCEEDKERENVNYCMTIKQLDLVPSGAKEFLRIFFLYGRRPGA